MRQYLLITDNSSPFEANFNITDFSLYKIVAGSSPSSMDINFYRYDNSVNSPELNGNNVTFRFKNSNLTGSEEVYIRGGFNGWNIDSNYKMSWNGTYFEKTVTISDTGNFEYKFYYNYGQDKWIYDPHNHRNSTGFYLNSILTK